MDNHRLEESYLRAFNLKRYEIIFDITKENEFNYQFAYFHIDNIEGSSFVDFEFIEAENEKDAFDIFKATKDIEIEYKSVNNFKENKRIYIHDFNEGKRILRKYIKQNTNKIMADESWYLSLYREDITKILSNVRSEWLIKSLSYICENSKEVQEHIEG